MTENSQIEEKLCDKQDVISKGNLKSIIRKLTKNVVKEYFDRKKLKLIKQ